MQTPANSLIDKFIECCRFHEIALSNVSDITEKEGLIALLLDCDDTLLASRLFRCYSLIRGIMQDLGIDLIKIAVQGEVYWRVSAKEYNLKDLNIMSSIFLPQKNELPSVDLNELYDCEYPVYINSLIDQRTLFFNPASISAQNTPPKELMDCVLLSLNYPDELEKRLNLLSREKNLKEYSFEGLRWNQQKADDGTILWRRKRMKFIQNTEFCEYLGQPAQLEIILQAHELSSYID